MLLEASQCDELSEIQAVPSNSQ